MIDKITLVKNNLSDLEILQIIDKNNLQYFYNESADLKIFDNAKTKNLTGGILIKIVGAKIKVEGSIHKYFHYLEYRTLENYTVFKMNDFLNTIETMFKNFGINASDFLIINYEIGLNVFIGSTDPLEFLKKAQSVGNLDGSQKKLYINPRYKNERVLTTQMHKDNTLVFRLYDKNFERLDKGKKSNIPPCLRIETLRTRQKNLNLNDFCKLSHLTILQNKFFKEWNLLNLDKEISAPPGTHQNKKDLAKQILIDGKNIVLKDLENRRNQITPKIYRTAKHFVKNWDLAPFWASFYNTAIQLVIETPYKIS
jgi:hypothetical protein